MISFILPVYNEADKLKRNVIRLKNFLDSLNINYEIIIAEDGSTDGSDRIAEGLSSDKKIVHIHSDKRLGKGGSLKNASSYVRGDYVIYMDADLATGLKHLKDVISFLKEYDVVIGSRYLKGSRASRTLKRFLLSKVYHFFVKFFFPGLKLTDTECGFKGFKRDVFLNLNKHVRNNGWSWDLEFLVKAKKYGLRIKEIPVSWKEGEDTKFNLFSDSLSQFLEILKIKFEIMK
ncbi:MAG: glycosyltransferase [Candidatus Aenigmarchaeota archaeon]|nr:glycosyltransferase [Candidatus Aenigmarchaeota archaeon]